MMSTANTRTPAAGGALALGLSGIALTGAGIFVSGGTKIAMAWLVALTFWIAVALGALLLVMLHHVFDAGWSVLLRRQYEHWLASFPWLAALFLPLLAASWVQPSLLWSWMDPGFDLAQAGGQGTVGQDVLWAKKAGFLNLHVFAAISLASFAAWVGLATILRRNSFAQDVDGDARWTLSSRRWAAGGLPLAAITLTACSILWVKSLDYHWFSSMYGVWYFTVAIRVALSLGLLLLLWLSRRGDLRGLLNDNHLHSLGQLMFAFTVFWAYVTFSQYFLIWNANLPEETFWYNLREMNNSDGQPNQWKWVGLTLLFGHFVAPFLTLLHYPTKVNRRFMPWVAAWIAAIALLDLCYNAMPSLRLPNGDPYPFFNDGLLWTATAFVGIGGVCAWAYLRSLSLGKLVPVCDPRIRECLTYDKLHAD